MKQEVIEAPTTYAQWADLFELLKEKTNDQEVLQAMQKGEIAWQSGVAERFVRKWMDTVNQRLDLAVNQFQKSRMRGGGTERELVQSLIALRKELGFLDRLMQLPAIPEEYQKQGVQLIKKQADSIQESLEESARNDRTGKLASIIRNHKVNAY